MSEESMKHPESDELRAFGLGQLGSAQAEQIAEHLDECSDCCDTILNLQDDTFVELVRDASQPAETSWIDPKDNASQVVGGWAWIAPQAQDSVLSVGLGLPPSKTVLTGPNASQEKDLSLSLTVNPRELLERKLLSGTWPRVVRQTPSLQLTLNSLGGLSTTTSSDWMELRGQLALVAVGES